MFILMISRGYPSEKDPQWGCFEKDQAEALADYGHKVIVVSIDNRLKKYRGKLGVHHFFHNGVEFYNLVSVPSIFFTKILGEEWFIKYFRYPRFKKILKKIIKEQRIPDIIYSQFFANTYIAAKAKLDFNIPVIGIEHLARFNNKTISKQDYTISSYAFANANVNIAVAKTLAANLEKRFNKKFEVVYNMFGQEFLDDYEIPALDNHQPIRFITVGSLVKRKGFDSLIEAFSKTDIPSNSWSLSIIGGGEEKSNLEALIKEKGLNANIKLLGEMDKPSIIEELKKSHIFVLPSRNENFSVAILEGLALGLPVLATDCGGIRECLTEENGIIVPVDDINAISKAIKQMIANYSTYDRNKIRLKARERFSPHAIATRLTDIFIQAIKH